ncbi:MAG: ATP-dependent metallopeptidase FtsH/Yme1/Tma family protein [Clostridiales bacterium]|nr:ATP-dependent metallopeptidase FtsH/Yme1/Tma family protein [Clostridiales bacterium]
MKKYWQSAGLYVLIFVIILAALAFSGKGLMQPAEEMKVYNYSDLINELDQDNVKTIEVTKSKEVSNYGTATAVLDDGTKMTVNVPSVDVLMEQVSQMPAEGSDIQIV